MNVYIKTETKDVCERKYEVKDYASDGGLTGDIISEESKKNRGVVEEKDKISVW